MRTDGLADSADQRGQNTATEDAKIKILLVDDHPLMRGGLKALLERHARFEICGEAETAADAAECAERTHPDLTVTDVTLKSSNGIELVKTLRARSPNMPILVLSMHDEEVYAERALRAGAMGYLMKHEAGDKVVMAIDRILSGEIYVSDRLKERMLNRFLDRPADKMMPLTEILSDREFEVLQLLGDGYSTRMIANQLSLGIKTVDSYREHLKEKLKLKDAGELVRFAVQWQRSRSE